MTILRPTQPLLSKVCSDPKVVKFEVLVVIKLIVQFGKFCSKYTIAARIILKRTKQISYMHV